jgi:NAD(P)-dependent dehydrogenase (short-subunit alcohol dehydrogenase family)
MAIATARLYAAEGAALALVARHGERLDSLAADLRARGASKVETLALDLDAASAEAPRHIESLAQRLDGMTHMLLFYGYLGTQEKASSDPAELMRILSVNFTSAVLWCEATADLIRRQSGGAIVAIGSVAGDRGRQSNYAYGAAKAGLGVYLQGLAHSLAAIPGAHAAVIKPGFVDTPMTDGLPKGGPLWASADQIAAIVHKAGAGGGPVKYAPGFWRMIMLAVRSTPAFVFHRTRL